MRAPPELEVLWASAKDPTRDHPCAGARGRPRTARAKDQRERSGDGEALRPATGDLQSGQRPRSGMSGTWVAGFYFVVRA